MSGTKLQTSHPSKKSLDRSAPVGEPSMTQARHKIVTIDGPAGAGKSSAAKALARRLGFVFLDTGAMYRAVTLAAVRAGIELHDAAALAHLARQVRIELLPDQVLLNGELVTDLIRTDAITTATKHAAANAGVRAHLVELQRQAAEGKNCVTEGRDQGTVVFPNADLKIFLTASSEERAKRRWQDPKANREQLQYEEVLARQNERDAGDIARDCGPLVKAPDAVEIITDGLTQEKVVDRLEQLAKEKWAQAH